MTAEDIDVADTFDTLADRASVLHYYTEVAATVLDGVELEVLQPVEKHSTELAGALVIAQAIMDCADACTARLERIADTLDDLVEAVERRAEGGEVSLK